MITEAKSMVDYFVQLDVVKSYWAFWFVMIFLLLTVVDCDTLTNPENGSVSHTAGTTFRQTATYSCDKSYNLVGSNTHTCQATGLWSWNAHQTVKVCCWSLSIEWNHTLAHRTYLLMLLKHWINTQAKYFWYLCQHIYLILFQSYYNIALKILSLYPLRYWVPQ